MSTKIYNGYYTNLSLEDLLPKFIELRPHFQKIIHTEFCKEFVKSTVYEYDQKHSSTMFSEFLVNNYKDVSEKISKLKPFERGLLIPFEDLAVNACVYPLKKDKTLILFYNETREVINFWESQDFVNDYHYQNQTDRPENISSKDWKQRIKDWDKVLGGNGFGIPVECGYNYKFCERELPYFFRNVLTGSINDYIPSDEKRKKRILLDKLWFEHSNILNQKLPGRKDSFSEFLKFQKDFYEKLESKELESKLNEIILPKLFESINPDELF